MVLEYIYQEYDCQRTEWTNAHQERHHTEDENELQENHFMLLSQLFCYRSSLVLPCRCIQVDSVVPNPAATDVTAA